MIHDLEIKVQTYQSCYDPHMLIAAKNYKIKFHSNNYYARDDIERGYGLTCKKTRNKKQHCKYGNRKGGNIKNLRFLTFNKGSSWYPKHRDMILKTIRDQNPHICIITESCFRPGEKNLYDDLDGYHIENKYLPGLSYARVTIIIKKGTVYERLSSLEDNLLSTIWLKVKVSKSSYIYVVGTYREHQYPKEMGIINSVNKHKQIERFVRVLGQVKSMSEHKVLMLGDINCDMLEANRSLGRYDIKEMISLYTEFMNEHKFALMNNKPTRHWPGVPSTLIDHILTNQPMNIDNIVTFPTHISDHEAVACNYHVQRLKERPKTILIRDHSILTRQNLLEAFMANDKLNDIFQIHDIDQKWEFLIEIYNGIINTLAPSRLIQIKDDKTPFLTPEIEDDIKSLDIQLTNAIQTKDMEEWRSYRAMRNILYRTIENLKSIFYIDLLKKSRQMWKTVKSLNKNDKGSTPTSIVVNNKLVSSPGKMCVALNGFFHNKILKIRQGFKNCKMDPIEILKKLIPR